ncbi:hypothetical protein L1D34_07145 [Vibrio mediterranei]|uniref:Rmf/CrpP family protein n=1 Tax=Vibrio mediterranei TaxID=689 RepID=UPI001EFCE862|nr:Rmf/CrpP family protein [Vibrio mediterranei]MCG9624614.1 hypothetical protein [Vibrio mediterranei]
MANNTISKTPYRQGLEAARDGLEIADCPYEDIRSADHKMYNFDGSKRALWLKGYKAYPRRAVTFDTLAPGQEFRLASGHTTYRFTKVMGCLYKGKKGCSNQLRYLAPDTCVVEL